MQASGIQFSGATGFITGFYSPWIHGSMDPLLPRQVLGERGFDNFQIVCHIDAALPGHL